MSHASLFGLFFGLATFLGAESTGAGDAHCDESAKVRARDARPKLQYPYQLRPSGPYCDGLTPSFNKGELDLVSLTLGPVRYTAAHASLRIAVHTDGQPGEVRLRGQDVRPDGSYRLDGVVPPAGLSVDLSAAIHPAGIAAQNLGVVAWREPTGRVVYHPVAAGDRESSAPVTVILSTPMKVIAAAREVCGGPEGPCEPQLKITGIEPLGNNQGSLIRFEVDGKAQAGEIWIKVTTLSPGNNYGARVIPVWLPARK